MTFGTSAFLATRFEVASKSDAYQLIAPLSKLLKASDAHVQTLCDKKYTRGELEQLAVCTNIVTTITHSSASSLNTKRYLAAQALAVPVLSNEPFSSGQLDIASADMLMVAADSFLELGLPQFKTLQQVCRDVTSWFAAKHCHKRMVLIESPLGNCVPIAVLQTLAQRAGLNSVVEVWNAPRNDRTRFGRTVDDSASAIANLVGENDIAVLLDDVLTGTRFIKTYDVLKKKLPGRLLPVALAFPQLPGRARDTTRLVSLQERMSRASADMDYPSTLIKLPSLREFQIDGSYPVVWETPVIWGDSDLVAGKRKVNLLFNIIEHLEKILNNLAQNGSLVRQLRIAWERDTNGERFEFAPGVLEQSLATCISKARLAKSIEKLTELGRVKYPLDFVGATTNLRQEDIRERWEWLRSSFLDLVSAELTKSEALFVWRAFDNTFAASQNDVRPRASRDHVYSSCALAYNNTLRSFHLRLVDRIANL